MSQSALRSTRASKLCAVVVLISFACGACTSWYGRTAPNLTPRSFDATTIRITRYDRSVVMVHRPRLQQDSVVGWSDRPGTPEAVPVGIPLADVQRVEKRGFDPLKTVGVVAGAYAVLSVLLFAVFGFYWGGE